MKITIKVERGKHKVETTAELPDKLTTQQIDDLHSSMLINVMVQLDHQERKDREATTFDPTRRN